MSISSYEKRNRKRSRGHEDDGISEERDRRTVFVTQLSIRLREGELYDFFDEEVGRVRSVRIVTDRVSRRSKGIGYVEFDDIASVEKALAVSGRSILGIPINVQLTEVERNRRAKAEARSAVERRPSRPLFKPTASDDPKVNARRVYVGSLHPSLTEGQIADLFAPFGELEGLSLPKDYETKLGRGYAFLQFSSEDAARNAMNSMDGVEVMGKAIKVSNVRKSEVDPLDSSRQAPVSDFRENASVPPSPSPVLSALPNKMEEARKELRQKLDEMRGSTPMKATVYLQLENMFDKDEETEATWVEDIKNDVKDECLKFGPVDKVVVHSKSDKGHVYVSYHSLSNAQNAHASLSGRWFGKKRIVVNYLSPEKFNSIVSSLSGV